MGLIGKKVFENYGISVIYCDGDVEKQNTVVNGSKVISPSELEQKYREGNIFICINHDTKAGEVRNRLLKAGCASIWDKDILLYKYKTRNLGCPATKEWDSNRKESENNILRIKGIDVDITEKCTLRCRDCINLISRIPSPRHFGAVDCVKSLEILASLTGVIDRVGIIGGEPFLHPGLSEICEAAFKIPNVLSLHIVTNGTVIPKKEVLSELKNYITLITISNYGRLSKNIKAVEELCVEYGIPVETRAEDISWTDLGAPEKRGRNEGKSKMIYRGCYFKDNCNALINGQLHLCPRSAFGTDLHLIKDNSTDYVDLFDEGVSEADKRKKIYFLLNKTKYLICCDYCSGMLGADIPPAIQAEARSHV